MPRDFSGLFRGEQTNVNRFNFNGFRADVLAEARQE